MQWKEKTGRIWRSFKTRILLSFFAFIRIFIVWICIYFFINNRQTHLDRFTYHLTVLQNHYAESNRYLQNFILTGFHQPSFYTTGRQKDLDLFEAEQDTILAELNQVKTEAADNHIKVNEQLESLLRLHAGLADTIRVLKQLYYLKGFKDYGAEGDMRRYAHYLEDSCPILKIDILMLRRREKDFMLRDEQKYIDEFNLIAGSQAHKFARSPATLQAIVNYQKYFNAFAGYTERLSINSDSGVYGHVQARIGLLDAGYRQTNARVVQEIASLNNLFKFILVFTFILLVAAAIYLSIALSHNLTKDIRKLNQDVGHFVQSGFREDRSEEDPLESKITEIQSLNNDISALRQALKQTIADLQLSIAEEKKTSAELESRIAELHGLINELEQKSRPKE